MKIFITGITGFLGREILKNLPPDATVGGLSRDEHKIGRFAQEFPHVKMFLGDITHSRDVSAALDEFNPDAIVHAAALKVVPRSELEPWLYVRTNILGTRNVLRAAPGVRLVFTSSDKAVDPHNTYGLTKRLAEKLVVNARQTVIRYGNVFGSTGSVIHLWSTQAKCGLPLTLTDPKMTRFFITARKAAQFALDVIGHSGIWVPKLFAYSLEDFLGTFIEICAPGAQVQRIPIRPGEKVHEVLVGVNEAHTATDYDDRFFVSPYGSGIPSAYSSATAPRIDLDVLRRVLKKGV